MSDVQNAIEELVVEQVDSRIEDAISESSEIASMKDDISDLEQKVNELDLDDLVSQVMLQLTETLVQGLYGNNTYVMVKKSYIEALKKKGEEGQNWGREPPFSFYKIMEKIKIEPDWENMYNVAISIVNTQIDKNNGKGIVVEMLKFGQRLYVDSLNNEKE